MSRAISTALQAILCASITVTITATVSSCAVIGEADGFGPVYVGASDLPDGGSCRAGSERYAFDAIELLSDVSKPAQTQQKKACQDVGGSLSGSTCTVDCAASGMVCLEGSGCQAAAFEPFCDDNSLVFSQNSHGNCVWNGQEALKLDGGKCSLSCGYALTCDADQGCVDGSKPCQPGGLGCSCLPDDSCQAVNWECIDDECVLPANCPEGQDYCPCKSAAPKCGPDSECNADDMCVPKGCTPGSNGCVCDSDGGCNNNNLECNNNFECVPKTTQCPAGQEHCSCRSQSPKCDGALECNSQNKCEKATQPPTTCTWDNSTPDDVPVSSCESVPGCTQDSTGLHGPCKEEFKQVGNTCIREEKYAACPGGNFQSCYYGNWTTCP